MRNNKKLFATFALLLAATLTGCGNSNITSQDISNNSDEQIITEQTETLSEAIDVEIDAETDEVTDEVKEVTFTDSLGREITVNNPQRIITLLGSFCDTWYLAGGTVVGTVKDSWTSFDLGLSDDVVNLGSMLSPDLEQLIAAEPDLVIASANNDAQLELKDTFDSAGITVAYFDVIDFDDYLNMLDIFTDITGNKDSFQTYGLDVKAQIDEVKASVPDYSEGEAPTVLFIRAAASSVKAKGSKGTVGGEILADLGCINIADTDGTLLEDLSLEAIVAADPDYIFVTTQGEDTEAALANVQELLISNPAWSSLTAVQNGRYYEIEKSLYNSKPNARWGEAYKKLADILYNN